MNLKEFNDSEGKNCQVCLLWRDRPDLKEEIFAARHSTPPIFLATIVKYLKQEHDIKNITIDMFRGHEKRSHDGS